MYFVEDFDNDKKRETFSYEWTPYPASLFEPDPDLLQGYALRKANKADYLVALRKHLGDDWVAEDQLNSTGDQTMLAFIQKYQDLGCKRFVDLQAKYRDKILASRPELCTCICFVGDRYDVDPAKSLKGEEREKRQKKGFKSRQYEINDVLAIPQWKHLINNPQNKAGLLNYLGESWSRDHTALPDGLVFMLGGVFKDPAKTIVLKSDEPAVELQELSCTDHEEADTRIFAHVAFCADLWLQAGSDTINRYGCYCDGHIPFSKYPWTE
jgi:hypothetical protein